MTAIINPTQPADVQAALVHDGAVRFAPPGVALADLPPFPAYVEQPKPIGDLPTGWAFRPKFERLESTNSARIDFEPGTSFYATGEIAGPLLRNGASTLLYNLDAVNYNDTSINLYQSHPFVLAVLNDGSAVGIIFESTWRATLDITQAVTFATTGPMPAVLIIQRATAAEVVQALAELTGRIPLPPRWSLGYHQCRWSYFPADRVRWIAQTFREKQLPCDCLWMDIDYMDGFRCFTVDLAGFGDPTALNRDLHALNFHTVWMIDPGLKADESYSVYASGRAGDHFVKDAQGNEFRGKVWPGECAFPDFTRAETREWWSKLYPEFLATGIDGVWNDMNEPAVFEAPEGTMPPDNRHDADAELGGPGPHTQYHNIYGMEMVRATREGVQNARPHKRPFVLTRANFLGGHRYAATWTGDNRSDWNHLRWAIPMALNMALSGQAFVGPDIGGFTGNASPELFARFMGIGALLPFARGHSVKESHDHEPWSFGDECEHICRLALQRRYRLLPYLYTLFAEAARNGMPVARPLFFADPTDARLRGEDSAFLLGEDLLVRADVDEHGTGPRSPMPAGDWKRFELTEQTHRALPELWLRAGAIVPVGPIMQYTSERPTDPLTLFVNLDASGQASGELYEDEGDGFGYQRGEFSRTRFRASPDGDALSLRMDHIEGQSSFAARKLAVEWLRKH